MVYPDSLLAGTARVAGTVTFFLVATIASERVDPDYKDVRAAKERFDVSTNPTQL